MVGKAFFFFSGILLCLTVLERFVLFCERSLKGVFWSGLDSLEFCQI